MANIPVPTFTDSVDQQFFLEPFGGPTHPENYLDRFPEEIYNLSPDSHLVRFMYTLLGPAGIGWLKKNYLDARLILGDHGFETFQIEKFYGDPFRFGRILSERYEEDPTGLLPREDWDRIKARDEQYRSRAIEYFNAARAGSTPLGMHLAAKSGLGHQVEIIENYKYLFDINSDEPKGFKYYGSTLSTSEFVVVPRLEVSRTEEQTITITGTPTGGTFTLGLNGRVAAPIAYNAVAATVQDVLEVLSNVGVGNVQVTGGPGDTGGVVFQPYVVRFTGALAGQDIPQLEVVANGLTGGVTPAVSIATTQGGLEAVDEEVTIDPELLHNLQSALDFLKPVNAIPTINAGRGLTSRQVWKSVVASSEYQEVIRYVTGSGNVPWPTSNPVNWIESGREKPGPRVHDDRQHHYIGFHGVNEVTASSTHAGAFRHTQSLLFPHLPQDTNLVHSADRVLADYAEPLTVTTQNAGTPSLAISTSPTSFINGIYPTSYVTLPGVPQVKYRDEQFWASAPKVTGSDSLTIDLGDPQAVNFVSFDILTQPLDIEIAFDTIDMAPSHNYVAVTPRDRVNFPTATFYESTNRNPWDYMEFHFADGRGRIPFTRYIRITFTRRSNGPASNVFDGVEYSVIAKNLRIGRNVA